MAPLEGLCRWMRKYRAGYSHPGIIRERREGLAREPGHSHLHPFFWGFKQINPHQNPLFSSFQHTKAENELGIKGRATRESIPEQCSGNGFFFSALQSTLCHSKKKKIFFFQVMEYLTNFSSQQQFQGSFLLTYCLYNLNSKTLVCWSLPLTSLSLGIHALKNPQILDLQNKSCLCFNFMPEIEIETTMLVVSVKLVRKCVQLTGNLLYEALDYTRGCL